MEWDGIMEGRDSGEGSGVKVQGRGGGEGNEWKLSKGWLIVWVRKGVSSCYGESFIRKYDIFSIHVYNIYTIYRYTQIYAIIVQ